MTFHITLEIYAELSVCTNSSGGGRGREEGRVERGRDDEGRRNGRRRGQTCTDKYSSSKTVQAFTVICYVFTRHRFTSTLIHFSH